MKKILVIDYDQASLATLSTALSYEGFEVVTAGDGQAGWEKYQREKPDLVLMEAMLSKIHGFELCDRITSDQSAKVPVFIITGVYKDRVYRTEALRTYGASEYFEKPLDMPKFIASVHAVLTVPDIKPDLSAEQAEETKPGNGEPAPEPEPVPVINPVREVHRRFEPSVEAAPAKAPAAHPKPGRDAGFPGDDGLNLETILGTQLESDKAATHKAKAVHDHAEPAPDIRLETLLNITPDKSETKHHDHPRTEAEGADIDRLLKTTLADFGLETEKKKPVKAPVPAPAAAFAKPVTPPPAPKAEPVPAKTQAAPPAATQKFKPAATPAPQTVIQEPAKHATPPSMPAAVAEKPKPPQSKPVVPSPFQAQPPAAARPAAKTAAPRPVAAPPAPKPAKKEPVSVPEPEAEVESRIFKDLDEVEKKKPPVLLIAAGVIVVAVAGFFILKPKRPAADMTAVQAAVTQPAAPEKAPEQTVPSLSEEKLKAMNAKAAQPTKPVEVLPTAREAIVPPPSLTLQKVADNRPETKPSGPKAADVKPAAETPVSQNQPGAKTEEAQPQTQATADNVASAPPAGAEPAAPPAAKANTGDLVDLVSVDEQPKIVKSVDPIYPTQAARFGKSGSVTVNALIDERGNVTDTRILKGLKDDMGLEKAAESAVRKWRFRPAMKDGVNVKVWKPVVITFKAASSRNG